MKKTLILLAFLAAACTAPVRETLVTDPADYVFHGQHLSRHRPPLGHELLDPADGEERGRMGLYL